MSLSEKKTQAIEPVRSIDDVMVGDVEENRNGEFKRSLSPRQIHVISLGSNIGSGLFIATGKALANSGPGNMIICYGLLCSAVWGILQSLAEMTTAFPVSGNFIDYADRWVDLALAFGAGFAEWLGWAAIIGSEATFFDVLVQYWAKDSFPLGASLTIFLVVCMSIFVFPNKWFGWFGYVTYLIKIVTFLIIILLSLAITLDADPLAMSTTGFANTFLLALWAVSDQVFIGIIRGEARNPRYSMAHATKLVFFRASVVYMLAITFITILVPSDDGRLLGSSGVAACWPSPPRPSTLRHESCAQCRIRN
ncbi:amino acid permease-domain-containing protein [Aspergillus caelatus]|uniref:Amino acid permease-domain-containing protein n=1 Tax=Aspergillus caelatus TaxID=61420 RepID=A0A5N6ZV95_9EURO|nr:amino acid permease-domain-containing protein [Aspergillus caelatus]KAE8361534.1 amino acid permease-domain-containing protein [Aspergillus caelatus]